MFLKKVVLIGASGIAIAGGSASSLNYLLNKNSSWTPRGKEVVAEQVIGKECKRWIEEEGWVDLKNIGNENNECSKLIKEFEDSIKKNFDNRSTSWMWVRKNKLNSVKITAELSKLNDDLLKSGYFEGPKPLKCFAKEFKGEQESVAIACGANLEKPNNNFSS
ncbi:hypothetical protein [Mycoplasma suis]|uniref:Uncharacterized protein n=2 Tax=Mycoplasma suis TaxID=57372 RepID=F0QRI3_MYCSL|nr:hypothetical protein [Mycoplasma suis]ADX98103.1 hypothetical protein MSU_0570 [Mycoplasma suis str. Illinois]CBZ40615.1 hypothetical protein MSUIS_05220 [Mycoplasma suis KI3806]